MSSIYITGVIIHVLITACTFVWVWLNNDKDDSLLLTKQFLPVLLVLSALWPIPWVGILGCLAMCVLIVTLVLVVYGPLMLIFGSKKPECFISKAKEETDNDV